MIQTQLSKLQGHVFISRWGSAVKDILLNKDEEEEKKKEEK
jgi:hypothetical protein